MELICTRDNVSNTYSWNQKIFRVVASSREKNFQGFAFDFCHVASGISPNPLACLRRWNFPYGISRCPPRLAWNVTTYVTSCGQILRPVPRDSINFDRGCRLNSSWIVWRDRVGPDPTPPPHFCFRIFSGTANSWNYSPPIDYGRGATIRLLFK